MGFNVTIDWADDRPMKRSMVWAPCGVVLSIYYYWYIIMSCQVWPFLAQIRQSLFC